MNPRPTIDSWYVRALAGAALSVAAAASFSVAAGASGVTAGSVIKAAQQGIAAETSVHIDFVAHSSSPTRTEKIIDDVGVASGKETVTEGTAHVALSFSSGIVYVSGNSAGLTTLFGMTSAEAKKVGRKWESWKSGSSQYATLKDDLTMPSVVALLPTAKGTTVSTRGTAISILKWTIPASASTPELSNTLTLSTGATTLPVTEHATAQGGTNVTTTLSKWDEQVLVDAPPAPDVISSAKVG